MRRLVHFLVLGTLIGVSGCETEGSRSSEASRWGTAGQDTAQRERTYEACKTYAEEQALRGSRGRDDSFGGLSASDPLTQMSAYDTRRTYQRILKACMESRGYGRSGNAARNLDERVEKLREPLRW